MRRVASVVLCGVLALALVAAVSAKRSADPKECEVCKKVMGTIIEQASKLEKKKNLEAVEDVLHKVCKDRTHPREKKLCYYIEPIKRDVSRPVSNGVPADRICKRLKKNSPEICELQYPIKMSEDVDVSKLRVKQLKKILADRGVDCKGCLEKRDFVKRVQETAHMEL
jgi:hypothetical protein